MLWLKRNLFFVLSMLVGLGLIGWAAYEYSSVSSTNAEVVAELKENRDKLKGLQTKNPYPSREAIAAAQEDKKRVEEFLAKFRTMFTPFPPPPALDEQGFKNRLTDTLAQLRTEATNSQVALPEKFGFGFSSLLDEVTYKSENIRPWLGELEEIKTICEILFNARVAAVDSIQRVKVAEDDTGANDVMFADTTTNQSGLWITTPYQITFRGYSDQIAAVLEGFARSPHCWIVKNVDVKQSLQQVPVVIPQEEVQPPPQMYRRPEMYPYGMDPRRDPRYQFGGDRGGGMPGMGGEQRMYRPNIPPPPGFQPAPPPGPVTVLSPKILFINLALDLVKLKPPEVETNKPPAATLTAGPRGAPQTQ